MQVTFMRDVSSEWLNTLPENARPVAAYLFRNQFTQPVAAGVAIKVYDLFKVSTVHQFRALSPEQLNECSEFLSPGETTPYRLTSFLLRLMKKLLITGDTIQFMNTMQKNPYVV